MIDQIFSHCDEHCRYSRFVAIAFHTNTLDLMRSKTKLLLKSRLPFRRKTLRGRK